MARATLGMLTFLVLSAGVAEASEPAQFFASRLVEWAPGDGYAFFPDPLLSLGGPRGGTGGQGSLDVVSLGVQGELVLGFAAGQALTDGPGDDLIVFENAFVAGGTHHFAELVRVGVSTDGLDYAFFRTECRRTEPVEPYELIDVSLLPNGFAGVQPVNADVGGDGEPGNGVDPFDPATAGGDAFNLADLELGDNPNPLVTSGAVDLGRIYYVKLRDVLGDGTELDDDGNPVYDPTGYMATPPNYPTSADIDAIAVVNGLPAPQTGDANRDGEVGIADLSALADHYGMSIGAIWEDGDFNADAAVGIADLSALADHYGAAGRQGSAAVPEPGGLILAAVCLSAGAARRRKR